MPRQTTVLSRFRRSYNWVDGSVLPLFFSLSLSCSVMVSKD